MDAKQAAGHTHPVRAAPGRHRGATLVLCSAVLSCQGTAQDTRVSSTSSPADAAPQRSDAGSPPPLAPVPRCPPGFDAGASPIRDRGLAWDVATSDFRYPVGLSYHAGRLYWVHEGYQGAWKVPGRPGALAFMGEHGAPEFKEEVWSLYAWGEDWVYTAAPSRYFDPFEPTVAPGRLMRYDPEGGETESIAVADDAPPEAFFAGYGYLQASVGYVTAGGGYIYWFEAVELPPEPPSVRIRRLAIAGSGGAELVLQQPCTTELCSQAPELDEGLVREGDALASAPLPFAATLAPVACDDRDVFWIHGSSLLQSSIGNSKAILRLSAPGPLLSLALDATHIYVTVGAPPDDVGDGGASRAPARTTSGAVLAVPRELAASAGVASPPAKLADAKEPRAIALSRDHVYWIEDEPGDAGCARIVRVPKGGGTIEPIANAQGAPSDLVIAEGAAFWFAREVPYDGPGRSFSPPPSEWDADLFAPTWLLEASLPGGS